MPHFRGLRLESLKVPSMDLQLCGLQVWCWLVSTVLWLVLVERQLDLSSMTTRLRGSSCVVLSRLCLLVVDVVLRLEMMSGGVRIGAMQTQVHTQVALQAQLLAQDPAPVP
ncbi:hypothetical protein Taro_052992, partial [Colocasia esculenta]|nr:hypothetical protein [Colocasia esculenta]